MVLETEPLMKMLRWRGIVDGDNSKVTCCIFQCLAPGSGAVKCRLWVNVTGDQHTANFAWSVCVKFSSEDQVQTDLLMVRILLLSHAPFDMQELLH